MILTKRLTEIQKDEIARLFELGKTIEDLCEEFKCTKLTITRNLKKILGEEKYNAVNKNRKEKRLYVGGDEFVPSANEDYLREKRNNNPNKEELENVEEEYFSLSPFMELTPLDCEIENVPQKDLSSIPISEIDFPKIVYLVVDKKIELETKLLKEYPEWHFLAEDELNRKTIAIYDDLKIAKRICSKEQKVIKVPNTEVFKIVAPILLDKGISRIVSSDKLIAL